MRHHDTEEPTHPAPETLRRFARASATRKEQQQVVRHLLTRCEPCAAVLRPDFVPRDDGPCSDHGYLSTFEGARQLCERASRDLEAERSEAKRRLEMLTEPTYDITRSRVEADSGFHTWAFVELLLAEGDRLAPQNPRKAFDLVRLAKLVSVRLDIRRYGVRRVRDLQARTLSLLGVLLRIRSQFHRAEGVFQQAKELLAEGTGDPVARAEILIDEAILYAKQGRYERAFGLLDEAVRIARRFKDSHLQGKALITKGVYSSYLDEEESAIQLLYAGIPLLDSRREPRLLLVAWHNVFFCLSYMGRNGEALDKLPYVRSLHETFGNRMDLLRLHWVEARIQADLGELERAEATYTRVRQQFIESGIGYEAAIVSLDLASLYLRQGRSEEVTRLAGEMIPILKSRDVHREAIAALIVFQKAVERETINLQLVTELEQYFRQARNDPSLRFHPSSP